MSGTRIQRWTRSPKAGFTLIEVVIVVLVASVLMDMAASGFVTSRRAVALESAEHSFRSLQARARAHAIERGRISRFEVDPTEDEVRVIVGTDTIAMLDFGDAYQVDLESRVSGTSVALRQCMTPRGVGDGPCTSFYAPAQVEFSRESRARRIRLLPLGQILDDA